MTIAKKAIENIVEKGEYAGNRQLGCLLKIVNAYYNT